MSEVRTGRTEATVEAPFYSVSVSAIASVNAVLARLLAWVHPVPAKLIRHLLLSALPSGGSAIAGSDSAASFADVVV